MPVSTDSMCAAARYAGMTTAMAGISVSGTWADDSVRSAAGYIGPVGRVEGERPGTDHARQRAADVAAVPFLGVAGEVAEKIAEALAPRARLAEVAEDIAREEPAAADAIGVGRRRSERMARGGPRIE